MDKFEQYLDQHITNYFGETSGVDSDFNRVYSLIMIIGILSLSYVAAVAKRALIPAHLPKLEALMLF